MAPAKRKRKPPPCPTAGSSPARVKCPACQEDEKFSWKASLEFGNCDLIETCGSEVGGSQGFKFAEALDCEYRSHDDGNEAHDVKEACDTRHGSVNQLFAPSSNGLTYVENEGRGRGEETTDSTMCSLSDLNTSKTQRNCGDQRDSGLQGAGDPAITSLSSFVCRQPLPQKGPKGLQVLENFVTPEEEEHLLRCLDADLSNPWKLSRVNGIHWGKSYGNHIFGDAKRRVVSQVSKPMPNFMLLYEKRMRCLVPVLKNFFPNEMNSIDYRKREGHYLKAHMDDRQLSGTVLVNLSLAGTCFMSYTRERGHKEAFRVKLPPRSLQVLTGESRYSYKHGIEKDDIVDSRRVSMTFRQSVGAS